MDFEKCKNLDEVMELFEREEKKEYERDKKLIEHFWKRGINHYILAHLLLRCSQYEEIHGLNKEY